MNDEVKFEQKELTDDAFFCTKSLWGFLYNKLTFDTTLNSQGCRFDCQNGFLKISKHLKAF